MGEACSRCPCFGVRLSGDRKEAGEVRQGESDEEWWGPEPHAHRLFAGGSLASCFTPRGGDSSLVEPLERRLQAGDRWRPAVEVCMAEGIWP